MSSSESSSPDHAVDALVQGLSRGDRSSLARLITLVENRDPLARRALRRIYRETGRARVVGVTGPPGAGKSTLVDRLIGRLRRDQRSVGVIAVDPSSPFSGGAVLGDRVRMQEHSLDPEVFIRSLSTRGRRGGVASATRDVVRLLDAFGLDDILLETVGVGQTEVDVMKIAERTIVVLVPESGDSIQAMKAGLLEIADIFVVNKSDRGGADRLASELRATVSSLPNGEPTIPVLQTCADRDEGIDDLVRAISRPRAAGRRFPAAARHEEVLEIVEEIVSRGLREALEAGALRDLGRAISDGAVDPYTAAERILEDPEALRKVLESLCKR